MKVYRAIIWAEEILPDNSPKARPGDVIIVRSREQYFISSPDQVEAVNRFKADIGKLSLRKS